MTRHMIRTRKVAMVAASLITTSLLPVGACHTTGSRDARSLDQNAVQVAVTAPTRDTVEDIQVRVDAIRMGGPAAFAELWQENQALIVRVREGGPGSLAPGQARAWTALRPVLEGAAQQRDVHMSGLYWFTDLERAMAEASATGKPILSLRMLGKLVDERSCANSRFFRTVLYSNQALSAYLGQNFVLHWSSERPVPQITIDFGDGRKVESTITGNSIHYVLDAQGRPIDALPGLYAPGRFRAGLDRALGLHERLSGFVAQRWNRKRAKELARYHRERSVELQAEFARMIGPSLPAATRMGSVPPPSGVAPSARRAVPIAMSKSFVETPMVPTPASLDPATMNGELSDAEWARLGDLHVAEVELDARSRELMRQKSFLSTTALARQGISGRQAFNERLASFRTLVAQDTVRNEFDLHRRIHDWFAGDQVADFAALNQRVYTELFWTPRSDPWLGLVTSSTYTGLEGDGIGR